MLRSMKAVAVALLAVTAAATPAAAVTVATFADPTAGSAPATPMFAFSSESGALYGSTFSGGWSGSGLTLDILGTEYDDVTFTFSTLFANGTTSFVDGIELVASLTDPAALGTLAFYDAGELLLSMTFQRAHLSSSTEFSSDVTMDVVDIFYMSSDPFLDPETLSFGFANPSGSLSSILSAPYGSGSGGTITWTASFTSSATLVPEPATIALCLIGLVGLRVAKPRRR